MRVLMLGWEFPPYKSGGLGTACYNMAQALAKAGVEVLFIQPQSVRDAAAVPLEPRVFLKGASGTRISVQQAAVLHTVASEVWRRNFSLRSILSPLHPYLSEQGYAAGETLQLHEEKASAEERLASFLTDGGTASHAVEIAGGYGPDLMAEVCRYSQAVLAIALNEDFDVIHAHDWMTYPAGVLVSKVTGKPLIVHAHALESDRSGENVNHEVAHMEWTGFSESDRIIAVSHYTRGKIISQYAIDPAKVSVVHNAVTRKEAVKAYRVPELVADEKRVLFLGRVTFQKGPEYFVEAARLVLERMPLVRFIMSGSGDMLTRMVRRVAHLGMGSRFHFTGFLKGEAVEHMYAISDLYVMPSVSEPFGISPLEAMVYDVPVIMSRSAGVAEVIRNALLVDFWDVKQLAEKICLVLAHPALAATMVKNCREELKHIKWDNAAREIMDVYDTAGTASWNATSAGAPESPNTRSRREAS